MSRLLVLCGFSGTGKTTVGRKLAASLDATLIGPDGFSDRWAGVLRRLDSGGPVIVECNRLHRRLRDRLHGTDAVVVELTTSIPVQRERLEGRGESDETVEKRIADRLSDGYGDEMPRSRVIDTTGRDVDELATELAELVIVRP